MKSLVIYATQVAGDILLKILKYFEIMLKTFEFFSVKKFVEY